MSIRSTIVGVIICSAGFSAFAAEKLIPEAAQNLTPSDFETTFATGKPLSATPPSGTSVTITFNPDGSAMVIPTGKKNGTKGKWRLSETGYCSTWGKGVEHSYTVQKIGERYDVINQYNTLVAQWTIK